MKKYINTNGEFYDGISIIFNNKLTFNPSEETLLEAGYTEYIEPKPTEEELKDNVKKIKLYELNEYDKSSNVNSFTVNNETIWIDAATRQQLRISLDAYKTTGLGDDLIIIKWFNGKQYSFTLSSWLYMLASVEVYASEALNVTEQHRANINALQTIEDIENYDFTLGYPNKPVF